ncbi:MAG: Bug family tripartite tricarboxylate transporter substrate binding protein [Lautropia sp.]
MRFLRLLALGAALLTTAAAAQTPALGDRPVQIVVPFTAGGNVDNVARIIAQGLTDQLKRNVVVENRAGANAIIGAEYVARAAPDGHTLLFATAETHAINPHIYAKLPYEPRGDFVSVGIVSRFPFALVISPGLPAATLGEFVAYAKQQAGKLNYASWGVGSTSQIAFEQLKQATGIDLTHVPFKGAAPAITAVVAGDVQALMVPLSVARPQAASGRVKLIAVTSETRDRSAPDIPTATEQGVPVVFGGWHLLAAPKGTPAAIVDGLNAALNAVTGNPEYAARLDKQGVRAVQSTPAEAGAMAASEWQRWGEVARAARVTAE